MPLPNRAKVSLSRKRAQTLQSRQLQQPKPVEVSKITLKRASYSEKQPTQRQENPMLEADSSQTMVENSNISASFSDYAENSGFSDNIEDYSQLDSSEPNFDSTSQEPNTTNNSIIASVLDYNNSGNTSGSDNNDNGLSTISPFTVNTNYSSIDSSKYANSNPNTEQVLSTSNSEAENVEIPPISEYNDDSWGEDDNSPIDDNASGISENELDNNNNNDENSSENLDDDNNSSGNDDNADSKNSVGKKASKFMGFKALIAQAKNEIGGKQSDSDENAANSGKTSQNRSKNAKIGVSMPGNGGEMLGNGENSSDERDLAENKDNAENSENQKNNGKNAENGGNGGNNPVLKLVKTAIALPLGALRLVLHVLSICFHGVYAIISSLGTILVLWAICNIPSIMLNTSADFDQDEGTTTVSNIKYDSKTGRIDAKITNSSDMIAHVDVGGELVSWQPFAKLPFSLFLPQQTGQCSNITISQINPDETRNITIQCSNAQGIWVRPKVVMKGI